MELALLSTIPTASGSYRLRAVSVEEARQVYLHDRYYGIRSHVGRRAASAMSRLLGVEVQVGEPGRPVELELGQEALYFFNLAPRGFKVIKRVS